LPRTNTEIDRDLGEPVSALRDLEKSVVALRLSVEYHRQHADLRVESLKDHAKRLEEQSAKLEAVVERLREQVVDAAQGLAKLVTDRENLKSRVEDDRSERRGLWAGLILAVIAALLGLGKDRVAGASRK
jgi:chromosome segregation ATPase